MRGLRAFDERHALHENAIRINDIHPAVIPRLEPRWPGHAGCYRRRVRGFVFETKFPATYDIDEDTVESLRVNDEALRQLGFDWLRNVMFNEPTIAMKQDVLQQAIGKAREGLGGA